MKKKIFAISDIHGCYKETIESLKNAGYDEFNSKHLLIVCGDIFDRGLENVQIFEWLYRLTQNNKAIVIRGNHDTMLIDFLDNSDDFFGYKINGICTTVDNFVGFDNSFESWCLLNKQNELLPSTFKKFSDITRKNIKKNYPNLLPWLESLPWYYETDNYIFVHGAIDTQAKNWRKPYNKTWEDLSFDDGSFLGKRMYNTYEKTVVAGHFHTYHLRYKYNMSNIKDPYDKLADHSILEINNEILGHKIFIDTCTPITKTVNVLVIEDKLL